MSEGYRTSGGAMLQVGGHAGVVSWGESLQPNEPLGLMGSHEKGAPKEPVFMRVRLTVIFRP